MTNILTVDGTVKITGGSPLLGKSLIATDSVGSAVWGIALTASNVGTGAKFYKETTDNGSSPYSNMKFRTVKGGAGFQVVEGADEITISKDLLIGPDTYIYIKLDTTSLGEATRSQFYNMKNTVMKKALQDLYATGKTEAEGNTDITTNGSQRYDTHVFVQDDFTERPFYEIMSSVSEPNIYQGTTYSAFPNDATSIISMFFIDESEGYSNFASPTSVSAMVLNDLSWIKTRVADLRSQGKTFKGYVFNVMTGGHSALENVFNYFNNNTGFYSGPITATGGGFNDDPTGDRWGVRLVTKVANSFGTYNGSGSVNAAGNFTTGLTPSEVSATASWPFYENIAYDVTRRFYSYEQYFLELVMDSVNAAGAYREIKAELPAGGVDVYGATPSIDIDGSIAVWTSRKNITNPNFNSAKIYGQFYSYLPGTQSVNQNTFTFNQPAPTWTANTIYINWEIGNNQRISLATASANVTMHFVNPKPGAHYLIKVHQGATPRTITFGNNYVGALTQDPTLTSIGAASIYPSTYQVGQTANSVTIMRMWYDGDKYFVETFGDSNTTSTAVVELDPVITRSISDPSTISPAPVSGDRYLIPVGAAGAWAGQDNKIAEWDGSAWQYYTPALDDVVFVTDTLTTLRFDGSVWVAYKGTAILQNGNTLANAINIGSNDNQNLTFKTNNTTRMTVLNSGNVGVNNVLPVANLHVRATTGTTASTVFKVDGNAGELFSVTDSLQGSLMSVNDISGLPILEVFDDNTVLMGDYQAPALNTTIKSILASSVSFQTVYQLPKALYSAVFFEYSIANSTNMRAGTVMAVWDGTNIEFTETSTADLGSTTPVTFQVAISGSNVLIQCRVTTSSWTLKAIIRSI